MRRPLVAALALVGVVGAAGIGYAAALQVRSPAQIALAAEAPEPSAITVPVERRVLSADVVTRGTVRFDTPAIVSLGGVPPDGTAAVVTQLPDPGDPVAEGAVLLQVSGRPVLVLEGALPMYRTLELGSRGDDVLQLESALARLGFDAGQVDGSFDAATGAGVAAWYASVGFSAQGPSEEEQESLDFARQRVRDAEAAQVAAEAQLALARAPVQRSVELAARSAVSQARDQVAAAAAAAAEALATAAADVAAAGVAVDQAQTTLAEAQAAQPSAAPPSAGNPDPVADAQAVLDTAVAEQQRAGAALGSVGARNAAEVGAARDGLAVAEAQLDETLAPPSTAVEVAAVATTVRELDDARAAVDDLAASTGISVPASEVVFLTGLPLRVDAVSAQLGDDATGDLLAVAGARQAIDSSVARGDVALLDVDMSVVIQSEELGITVPGTMSEIAAEPGTEDLDPQRHYIEVVPDAFSAELTGASVRITIPVQSTDGEVLVVPVAALSSSASGQARVEVAGPSGDVDDVTGVDVRPGLSSGGMVEVEPVGDDLAEGDRVVVGRDG